MIRSIEFMESAIQVLEGSAPELLALAEAVSLASFIEPTLLRRARLELAPRANSGTEADLWFSPFVETRLARGFTLDAGAAHLLQQRLATETKRLTSAWHLIQQCHAAHPPAQLAAEELTFLGLRPPDTTSLARIDEILREVLVALVRDERSRLAYWAARTLPRLPERIAESQNFYLLSWAAATRIPDSGRFPLETIPAEAIRTELAAFLPTNIKRVEVGITRDENSLIFTVPPENSEYRIALPKTNPLVIEILDVSDGSLPGRIEILSPTGRTKIASGPEPLTIATGLQELYDLPRRGFRPDAVPLRGYRFGERPAEIVPDQLGVQVHETGINFALASEHATSVELCIFDALGRRQIQRLDMKPSSEGIWNGFLAEAIPGLVYGYRVHGEYAPERGQRYNSNKLLLDPYAREIIGELRWHDALFGYKTGSRDADLSIDRRDSAFAMPKAVVTKPNADSTKSERPRTPWHQTNLYEIHVRGFTIRHPEVAEEDRGTYLALASPPVIKHLLNMGVTTLLLLPVFEFVDDRVLVDRGLKKYWGFSPLAFFAPSRRYAREDPISEFREMVARLHSAGLEVVLWVPISTSEGNHFGPTLNFRGINNATYYRLMPDRPRYYENNTGQGNEFATEGPLALTFLMDCLRYWAEEMHVDGFCFELASTLGRVNGHFEQQEAPIFDALRSDSLLNKLKMIAEPWDVGPGGYRLGEFPTEWGELNDEVRTAIRTFWCNKPSKSIAALAQCLAGSPHIFDPHKRETWCSINHVTIHDGFTLQDLVSYDEKHNEANGEDNRDGADDNLSWNCGVEGPTDDPNVLVIRERLKRACLATLFLCRGTPLLLGGDEIGQTQNGNNNTYCQDNEISWLDWSPIQTSIKHQSDLREFISRLAKLRREHPALTESAPEAGSTQRIESERDFRWFRRNGEEMRESDWTADAQDFAMMVQKTNSKTAFSDILLAMFNPTPDPIDFRLPLPKISGWQVLQDSSEPTSSSGMVSQLARVEGYSVLILSPSHNEAIV